MGELPKNSEDENGRNKWDEGGSVASGVHLFEVREVSCLKNKWDNRKNKSFINDNLNWYTSACIDVLLSNSTPLILTGVMWSLHAGITLL